MVYIEKCPHCNAPLNDNVENSSGLYFCKYCGSKIIDPSVKTINLNINKTEKTVDEAKIVESNNKRELEEKKLEAEIAQKKKDSKTGFLGLLLFIALFIFVFYGPEYRDQQEIKAGKIRAGTDSESFIGEPYQTVEATLKSAGFTDIQLIDLNDSVFFLGNDGKVTSVSIGGRSEFQSYYFFYPDEQVIITYH